jgi:glycine/D-amino acid oxidase-like deaminating enzyme
MMYHPIPHCRRPSSYADSDEFIRIEVKFMSGESSVVVGGGFFGCVIACRLRQYFASVTLVEQSDDLLQHASYANQARVHHGYHYPRSLLTAARSQRCYRRFLRDYADCVDRGFAKYYAIARHFSKVNGEYFESFCRHIGAPVGPAPAAVSRLFDPELVESVFAVEECAFHAGRLRNRLREELSAAGVDVQLATQVRDVRRTVGGLELRCSSPHGPTARTADHVFLCTYNRINQILHPSGLPLLPLKLELAELALVDVPPVLQRLGVTVMCGPFFSCMPFPARGLHSLSHVRYTPHQSWQEGAGTVPVERAEPRTTNFPWMCKDAARYLPAMNGCRYRDSLWAVKTVLRASEGNDSRPILFQRDVGVPGLHCVLGAKLDNVYDILDELDMAFGAQRAAA